jgi:hypothetical protein
MRRQFVSRASRMESEAMKPKDQFTFDVALFVGATFVAAAVVFGLSYYFFLR